MEWRNDTGETRPSDILDLPDAWEERERLVREVLNRGDYQENLERNLHDWKNRLLDAYPKLNKADLLQSVDEAIKGITFIDFFCRLHNADATFLQPRTPGSEDPLLKVGVEDLVEKFVSGRLQEAIDQVRDGKYLLDTALSMKHNIRLGFMPQYIIREEAIGLWGHLRVLNKNKE